MKPLNTITFISILCLFTSLFTNASPKSMADVGEYNLLTQKSTVNSNYFSLKMASVDDYIQPRKPGACYSSRNCTGKRIGIHQHAHNCKNAGGKSWQSGVTEKCHNL